MGPPTSTMMLAAASSVLLLASVARAQHEGFQIAPPAIHSGVVAFRRDQYRYLRQAYDPAQQYPQAGPPQNAYQPQPNPAYETRGPPAFGPRSIILRSSSKLQQVRQPAATVDPDYSAASTNQQQLARQQLQQQQVQGGYAQQPLPAPNSPFLPQQQQQFQALPIAQPQQFQQQQSQQYPQPAPPQPLPAPPVLQQQLPQQGYVAQPFPVQYSAPPQQLQQRPAAVIAPPPRVQQLPVAVARPAPPPQQLQLQTAPPPPARFTPYVADVRDPAAAVAATVQPARAFSPVETVTVVTVDTHAEQVADLSHSRAQARKKLKNKKRVKVLPTVVETVTVSAPPVTAHRASHRIVTTTFPPSFSPQSFTRQQQQQRVRPSTPHLAPPPQIVTQPPPARVHKPSNRPSKLVELTTAAAVSAGGGRDPNDVFLQCCRDTGIDSKCHSRCNFDTLTKKVLTGMFLGTDPCPQKNGRGMLECAAQKGDHTQCCMERRVHTTAAKNKCLGFCVMTPGSSFMADISMLPCWAVLNDIKGCFEDAILDQ
ncbi:hypothetical protein PRIPAC_89948 [Pristionchus pacificus]|uniref:DB domain-containing protein n=1 Tax=Pristionchus pacificus TaxID=54126 RepID=A0A2A6B869_PRIPA|nr:hypothetical protein PRIPAC_89948 [Pristionchus pacificus]|eukprot:PDM62064.1 hypothetical protein PRIPAC_51506 [Pristionchus pacificus]